MRVQFTGQSYGQVIDSGMEATIEYKFFPSPQLEPMALAMALTVFYEDAETVYGSTFFNATVNFVDHSSPIDVRSTFKLLLVVAVIAVIVYVFTQSNSKPARRSSRKVENTFVEGEFAQKFIERSVSPFGSV